MKSINSQSARNAGVAALGFASVLILWHLVGYYALISCVIGGAGMNRKSAVFVARTNQ